MGVSVALRQAAAKLAAASDTARLDAELLMAHALGVSRSDMLLRSMGDPVPEGFDALVQRRAKQEPVAYIIGRQEFCGLDLAVTHDVLIPRGDSETLIDAAGDRFDAAGPQRILDLGTGSGALLLAALVRWPGAVGVGIDRSFAAVLVALENSLRLGINQRPEASDLAQAPPGISAVGRLGRAQFRQVSWRERGWATNYEPFDLILCNPPYVEDDAELDPDVRDYEPASALFAGPEGLDDYRILIPQLRALMRENGVAIFEIGHRQAESVEAIARENGFAVELRRDLADRPRALVLR